MNSNNSTEIIEISDDSGDNSHNNQGPSRIATKKRMRHSSNSDSSLSTTSSSYTSDEIQWIEEDSESEPEFECEIWDTDCLVLDLKYCSKPIHGYHLMPTCCFEQESPTKLPKLSAQMNDTFLSEEFVSTLRDNFKNDNSVNEKNCEIIVEPWKVLILNNVLDETCILDNVRQEFYDIKWNKRTMDLYEFFQSEDIKDMNEKYINIIYNFIKSDLKNWVAKFTGIELTDVSATCSYYSDTDFLLTHDDQQGSRAVAFVLYITDEEWNPDWGGQLQLLDKDENHQPLNPKKNISPANNRLVLFPVSDHSYHQVEEVTCKNYCRLSINGWFHAKEDLTFETPIYKEPICGIYSNTSNEPIQFEIDLKEWIDDEYLHDESITQIQKHMEEHSEMSLHLFFNPAKVKEITQVLNSNTLKWETMGPRNRRNYEVLLEENIGENALADLIKMIKSDAMFYLLNRYTHLEIEHMKYEVQKWTPGCYSLLNDKTKYQLDVIMYLGECANVIGGKTQYVSLEHEVQTALISLEPRENTVNLVYGDTARYTSAVSKYSQSKCFYTLAATYLEGEDSFIDK